MNYRLITEKSFEQVLEDLQSKVAENGFRVLHIHNVQQTLHEKGFEIEKYSIVEVCNAKFANNLLALRKEYGVMMPCKINVYTENGKTYITMPEPSDMVVRFGMTDAVEIAKEVDIVLKKIMDETV